MTSGILPLGYASLNTLIPACFPPPSSYETRRSIRLVHWHVRALPRSNIPSERGRSLEQSVLLDNDGMTRVERNWYECAKEVERRRCYGF